MPFKNAEKRKAYNKAAMQRRREGNTPAGNTDRVTQDLLPDDELFAGLPAQLQIYANSEQGGEQGGEQYRKLIHHLKTTPIEQLQTESIPFIPCWRHIAETKERQVAGFNKGK